MATIVTRAGKGSPLTNAEMDANLNNLNNEFPTKQPLDDQLTTLAAITATQATDLAAVSTFMGTVLNDASQAVALTTLGAPLNATTALTAAYTVVAADRGKLFDCTGTFTITLTAAATLGAGFSFAVRNSGTGVITLDPNAAELVDGVATITYVAGVSSMVTCDGAAFKTVGKASAAQEVLHARDEKAAGTAGGTSVAGNQTRILNAIVKNTITGASLTTNDITLPAGTYRLNASAPGYGIGSHRLRLFNVTDAVVTLLGTVEASSATSSKSLISGEFTISAAKVFRFTHFTQAVLAINGLGNAVSDTFLEVYTQCLFVKVA